MKSPVYFLLGLLISLCIVPLGYAVECTSYPEISYSGTGTAYYEGELYTDDSAGYFNACVGPDYAYTDVGPHYIVDVHDSRIVKVVYFYTGTAGTCNEGSTYMRAKYTEWRKTFTACDMPPAEPETCFNGVMDGDEEGINCGGSCSAPCEEICPPNTENLIGFDGQPGCFWYGLKDSLGNCPGGTTPADDQGYPDACYKEYSTIPAVAGTEVDAVDDLSFTAGSLSTVEQVYPTTTTDNGDGTSSKTTITESVGPGGETTTTTKTDVIDNVTGAVLSSTTTTDQEVPVEENPDNYSYDIGDGELPDSEFMDLPEEKNFDSLFDQVDSWNPFANMDEKMKITVANPTCSFGCDIDLSSMYLGSYTLEFGLCEYEWAFNAIGVVLNFGAVFLSFCIVVRG